ncbi:hypothetical protein [Parasitella parasitica]|uniref:rhomboid protease n=1 Tax=Parasitella parasitica TaxID=35722 RepID=A0A0B7NFX4_9FUNG|nr:hypothetical protein [Parasitella parasitica]
MFPIYTSDSAASLKTAASASATRHGHARKLSHIQFGKRSYIHDEYTSSSSLMIPFDELHPSHKKVDSISSDITAAHTAPTTTAAATHSSLSPDDPSSLQEKGLHSQQSHWKKRHWMLSSNYWGPFSKGEHWPLFTYLMVMFTIIIFSGEMLLSKQSSGEFFELEPFNYMLGPSMEIMIQVGARFAPCMRHVDSMPPEERYVCLHTIAEKNKTPAAAAAAAAVAALGKNNSTTMAGGQSLLLLDPVVNLADPRLLNSSCSLQSICGMTTFHQNQVPDQTYRLLTPLFIHTGLIHLAINLSVLICTRRQSGKILYIGSGVFGHALGANFAPPTTRKPSLLIRPTGLFIHRSDTQLEAFRTAYSLPDQAVARNGTQLYFGTIAWRGYILAFGRVRSRNYTELIVEASYPTGCSDRWQKETGFILPGKTAVPLFVWIATRNSSASFCNKQD